STLPQRGEHQMGWPPLAKGGTWTAAREAGGATDDEDDDNNFGATVESFTDAVPAFELPNGEEQVSPICATKTLKYQSYVVLTMHRGIGVPGATVVTAGWCVPMAYGSCGNSPMR